MILAEKRSKRRVFNPGDVRVRLPVPISIMQVDAASLMCGGVCIEIFGLRYKAILVRVDLDAASALEPLDIVWADCTLAFDGEPLRIEGHAD